MALRYLQSKSVRYLKRSLQEMNETIRRVFYYGTDFTHTHNQMILGNDISALDDEDTETEIVQNKFVESPIVNNDEDEDKIVFMDDVPASYSNVCNLGDLTNKSCTSLDDYLKSPKTT